MNYRRIGTILMPLAVVTFLGACDNPVAEDEDHAEAGGVVVLDAGSGAPLTQSIGPVAAFSEPLTMQAGADLEVIVKFLDAADPADLGRAFSPHEDDGESLRVTVTNTAILEYHDHGDHGDFEAKAAGATTVRFELWHGTHADYRSGLLEVVVQ